MRSPRLRRCLLLSLVLSAAFSCTRGPAPDELAAERRSAELNQVLDGGAAAIRYRLTPTEGGLDCEVLSINGKPVSRETGDGFFCDGFLARWVEPFPEAEEIHEAMRLIQLGYR